tara:strand:+ start:419 stop:544 length:126 start_codon:yes stop_codon:yes gene_type:complete
MDPKKPEPDIAEDLDGMHPALWVSLLVTIVFAMVISFAMAT